jgi:hypothetical protein
MSSYLGAADTQRRANNQNNTTGATGGNETRPKNVNYLTIIKY